MFKPESYRLEQTSIEKLQDIFSDDFPQSLVKLWSERELQGKCFWICKGLEPVAFVLVEETDRGVVNRGLFVKFSEHSQGLGQRLLDHVHTTYSSEFIWTNITKGSEGIYRKNGYIELGERNGLNQIIAYYPNGKESQDYINYLKSKL